MSEIVERLHKTPLYYGSGEASALGEQAADEIDRLTARVKALEEGLADLLSWVPEKPSPPEWRMTAGEYGADDAINHARALLTPAPEKEPTNG